MRRLLASALLALTLAAGALAQSIPFPGPGGVASGCNTSAVVVLTTAGANTWANNIAGCTVFTFDVIAGGGGGASARGGSASIHVSCGGGGGAFSRFTPQTVAASASVGYTVGAKGVGATRTTNGLTAGTNGGDSWICSGTANCASLAGTAVVAGAQHGTGGAGDFSGNTCSGGAGGASASGFGSTKTSGGRGGNISTASDNVATGGGGAAGLGGAGSQGVDSAGQSETATNGGAGVTGAAGVAPGGAGGNGTEFDATHGSGGGGAGRVQSTTAAGNGGQCGGGGGGSATDILNPTISGDGNDGCIIIRPVS